KIIIDPYDAGIGNWIALWKDKKPVGKNDFYEYSFDDAPALKVPGDFNSQLPGLNFYESTVWYKKEFDYARKNNKKLFIHFGAVNYKTDVFINGQKAGSHEGGFTPFVFEITNLVTDGKNSVIVRTNNARIKNGVPGLGYDWFNYGGITRDVNLVEEPSSFISDYFIQLKKGSSDEIQGWVKIVGDYLQQEVTVQIPELKTVYKTRAGSDGMAHILFTAKPKLWFPANPKLYQVKVSCETDSVKEKIGFRTIEVNNTSILLNNTPVFLKGINIHEEIPGEKRRSWSEKDALQLLSWAKELGCNFVRLAHYPHSEYMTRVADSMGLMVWSEIPVYQGIDFLDSSVQQKMNNMLREMIDRDKNRCSIILWSLSNETSPGFARTKSIGLLADLCRTLDSTRLITSAINSVHYKDSSASIEDSLVDKLDVISVNEYFGWYVPWPCDPENFTWKSRFNKPLIISEFGGEALYGNKKEPKDAASSWSEDYQERIYKDQLRMFQHISFLAGTCAWILADFRSPVRMNSVFQKGWNRKGLLSDQRKKKKAWYVLQQFYRSKK
ncbi:MAG TPA: glycoside hydrolase family 2 TIM barrel-domain containing protein, partial [Chitinophagaceae bacterium]|nr:glycoside hydrolase family 2 TIM barrel-domain containing protein [Chitinophagaceae bacterium]